MKKEIKFTSTNGRWGLNVVVPTDATLPLEGKLMSYGEIEGHKTFEIIPEKTGVFYDIFGEVKIHGGASVVAEVGLQSSNTATLVAMSDVAIIESYGYKNRSSSISVYHHGVAKDIPAGVLATMGLLPGITGESVEVEIPSVKGAMQLALEKAGLLKN